jgi:hypothetical protein
MRTLQHFCMLMILTAGLVTLAGCTPAASTPGPDSSKKEGTPTAKAKHDDHSGYWCNEHGLPEEECWACSSKYAKARKAAGDWCEKHDRPDSQCFKCHPELKAKWAEKYKAKFPGQEPPAFEDY